MNAEDDLNINAGAIEFDWTESPIVARNASHKRHVKSPWFYGLQHPIRDTTLTIPLYRWLECATPEDLDRVWIIHSEPSYIEISGKMLQDNFVHTKQFSYDIIDLCLRHLKQLDSNMTDSVDGLRWRHILESNFSMLVLADEDPLSSKSIREQFVGETIVVPVQPSSSWCCYVWDMKNRTVHVIDPLFALGRAADFVSTHGPNITKLQNALAKCISVFFTGWLPDWDGWKQNFVLPIDAPDASKQSGLICLMAVRDFDGTEIRQSYNDGTDKLAGFRVNMLYELMSIEQNGAKLPEAFIHSVDD